MKKILPFPTGVRRTDEARELWINAACQGHLTSEQLGEKLGISATEAQVIVVDAQLRDAINAVLESNRNLSSWKRFVGNFSRGGRATVSAKSGCWQPTES